MAVYIMNPDSHDTNPPYTNNHNPVRDSAPGNGIDHSAFGFLPFKSRDVLTKVMSRRVTFLKTSIRELNGLLQERQKLRDSMKSGIDENLCVVQSQLYGLDALANVSPERKSSLEGQIMELYKERRRQELLHFQDTVALKQELRNLEKELRTATLDLWMLQFLP